MSPAATLLPVEAEAVALRIADQLFYTRGIAAVTMADIRDNSGVSMRRLYALYPAKSDLVAAWLKHRHREWMAEFKAGVASHRSRSASPIEAVFLALEDWMTRANFTGCGFINTHAERSELTDEHRDIIAGHKRSLTLFLEELTGAGPSLAVLIDGAIVQASIFGDVEPIRVGRSIAVAALGEGRRPE